MNIEQFLEVRIAEDEDEAREFQHYEDEVWETAGWWNPTRVLAECAAKRILLRDWKEVVIQHRRAYLVDPPIAPVVAAVAAVYADHPDYRPEWALDAPSQS